MKISVFSGMYIPQNNTRIINDAKKIGQLLGQNGHTLVQGGCDKGLMGITLNEFLKYSKDVEMVVPKVYEKELKGLSYKEKHITKDLTERLKKFIEISDDIVVLPGGMGMLLELLYSSETRRVGEHTSNISVINTSGFFDGLRFQEETAIEEGLSSGLRNVQFMNINEYSRYLESKTLSPNK